MGGRRPEGCIRGTGNTRMEETSWGDKNGGAFEGGQDPEGAVEPYVAGRTTRTCEVTCKAIRPGPSHGCATGACSPPLSYTAISNR
jgi:hypothetical protein